MAFSDNNEERDDMIQLIVHNTGTNNLNLQYNRIIEQWTTKEKYCSTVHYG